MILEMRNKPIQPERQQEFVALFAQMNVSEKSNKKFKTLGTSAKALTTHPFSKQSKLFRSTPKFIFIFLENFATLTILQHAF